MKEIAVDLENLSLQIPPLWEKDWDDALDNAVGSEAKLLKIQFKGVNLLQKINDKRVTFARLAWLNLWTKTFSALDGALCAIAKNSKYVLEMLVRSSFEQWLHVRTITKPMFEISHLKLYDRKEIERKIKKDSEGECLKRFEAYTAWCLWNDYLHYISILDRSTLNAIWNHDPAKKIKDDSTSLEAYESIFGPLTIETNEQILRKGMLLQQDIGSKKINRIKFWLDHPDLIGWHKKLEEKSGKKNNFVTFFTLVGETERGIKSCLKDFGLSFGYPLFNEGSLIYVNP